MEQPKVSIIVPVYGVEKYLHQCIDSILAQTLKEIEIILVDDGSKDKCPEIIDDYSKKDDRIVVVHQPNSGYGSAINHGLDIATGKYIGIVEPDDWIEPSMYEKLYERAVQTGVDIVKSDFFNMFPSREFKNGWGEKFEIPKSPFSFEENPIFLCLHPSIWSCLYKTSLIQENHIRVQEIAGAGWTDNLFQIKTLYYSKKIAFIDEAFYHYRRRNEDDAKDLKDWHIPFNRTEEIHEWMRKQKIINSNVWECLYKRELSYICLVCRMLPFKDIKNASERIKACLNNMNPDILNQNNFIGKKERKKIKFFLSHPIWGILNEKGIINPHRIRQFFITIHISKRGFLFQFFGIQIAKGKHPFRPALLKFNIGVKK